MPDTSAALFTYQSFGTLAGSSLAVVVVTNTYRKLFRSESAWPAFIAALAISFAGAYVANKWLDVPDALLILLNSCLLFCSALGIQDVVVTGNDRARAAAPSVKPQGRPKSVNWISSWFKR